MGVLQAGSLLREGALTSTGIVTEALERAEKYDPILGVYTSRYDEAALRAAEIADRELASGHDRGPLHGLPIGIKDLISTVEGPTTAQSRVNDGQEDLFHDAISVRRLRAAGAIVVGKTSLMEFGLGMPDPQAPFPLPRNPWDARRWAGGSSSGSAAGVAAGFFLGALGTDTGGSIRAPAAFCGVTGLKATYGLVPLQGCVGLAESLDHLGPIARSAVDCAFVLDALTTPESEIGEGRGPRSVYVPGNPPSLDGLRVGVGKAGHFVGDEEPGIEEVFDDAVELLEQLGASVCQVELPLYEELGAAMLVTSLAEGCAIHRDRLRTQWSRYNSTTRQMLAWGEFFNAVDYVQAQRVRGAGQAALAELYRSVDVMLTPTATMVAPVLAAVEAEAGALELLRRAHTAFWSAVGYPVISVPIGFSPSGMPLGGQIAAPPFHEKTLVGVAMAYQEATKWHLESPPLRTTVDVVPREDSHG